jgi:hypothetical protein
MRTAWNDMSGFVLTFRPLKTKRKICLETPASRYRMARLLVTEGGNSQLGRCDNRTPNLVTDPVLLNDRRICSYQEFCTTTNNS